MNQPLTFSTEKDKTTALEDLENKPGGLNESDLEKIDSISNAEIKASEETESTDGDNVENVENKSVAEPATVENTTVDPRDWNINDELISKYDDEYVDETGRKRRIITQYNADDFVKSYVHSEKNNHYLKTIKGPQDIKSAEERGKGAAKTEYDANIAALQKEIDELKAKPAVERTEQPLPSFVPATGDTVTKYNETMQKINDLADGDEIEHTDLLKKAIVLGDKIRHENDAKNAENINKITTDLTATTQNQINQLKTDLDTKQQKATEDANAKTAQQQAIQDRTNSQNEIDVFASSKNSPAELKTGQNFSDMHKEAMSFHNQLAEIYTGKNESSYNTKEWNNLCEKAGTLYLNGGPELVSKANSYGISAPKNYNAWVKLDQIDAIRTGWWRNAQTNEWEKRYTPQGKEINLGDMDTAYNYYLDQTGERQKKIKADKDKAIDGVIHAVNKRDIVQLDDSQMNQDGQNALTEDSAKAILETTEPEYAMREYRKGNKEPLQRLNAAMVRLYPDTEPIDPSKF